MQMSLKSRKRRMELQKLLNEGNYKHNVEVLQKGEGALVVCRRPHSSTCASEYIPCEFCKGFFHEKQLWIHAKSCYFADNGYDNEKNFVRNGRCMLAPFLRRADNDENNLNSVIEKMKETEKYPGLKETCFHDELIREFGMWLLDKLGNDDEQRRKDLDNVRTKMRSLARLLSKLNEPKLFAQPLCNFLCAKEFNAVVTAVKSCSKEADSPQLALTLGHYIKQVALLKASVALQKDDPTKKKQPMSLWRCILHNGILRFQLLPIEENVSEL
ncbi:hypothetical protein ScPMuIL_002283 [Solemya velum]